MDTVVLSFFYHDTEWDAYFADVTFEHYTSDGAGSTDFAISTNKDQDNFQHPVYVSGLTLNDVDITSKVYYHEPNIG